MKGIKVEVVRMVAGGTTETTFLDMKGVLDIVFVLPVSPRRTINISEGRQGPHSLDIRVIDANLKILPQANNSITIEAALHRRAT